MSNQRFCGWMQPPYDTPFCAQPNFVWLQKNPCNFLSEAPNSRVQPDFRWSRPQLALVNTAISTRTSITLSPIHRYHALKSVVGTHLQCFATRVRASHSHTKQTMNAHTVYSPQTKQRARLLHVQYSASALSPIHETSCGARICSGISPTMLC